MDLRPDIPPKKWPRELQKPSALQKWLHRHHADRFATLLNVLWNSHDPKPRRWASRLANCCRYASITYTPSTGQTKPWLSTCGSRLCPFCGRGRATRMARKLEPRIASMKRPKHLVLTFRSTDLPLPEQLQKLRRCFAQLRRTRVWRDSVAGGIYSIEVTRNNESGLWHPHLHAVIDSKYIPQKVLTLLWGKLIGDTAYIWIAQVNNARNIAWELGKYVGKPPDTRGWPPSAVLTHARALHHQRMMQAFGNQHGAALPKPAEPSADPPDVADISIPHIAYLAAQDHPVALDLAALMYARWPMFRAYLDELCPAAAEAEVLATLPDHDMPRAPPGPDGLPGVVRNPAQLRELEILMQLVAIQWLQLESAGTLADPRQNMEAPT